ncbi:Roadkill [Operophtera brumata]|uniref:Roadkill n=1 Tax=Operophtera brumata TaxID=104452 RepID=A0A0L7LUK8_OPEBR|nr:Roadkill [Operophtera brumata]
MSQGFRTPRCTIVEVPDTPFQLKMCFFGTNQIDLMEIYYLSSSSVYMQCGVNVRIGKGLLENSLVDYRAVQSNEWQYCMGLKNIANILASCFFGYLVLSFKFTVSQVATVCNNLPPHIPRMREDFETLLNDANSSDVIMKSVEGIEFRAHRSVLAVHSKVLRAHFEHNMRESITNVVETLWETNVLRDVLAFVYKDEVPQVDHADKLLAAADYYQLERLKSLCEEALIKRLTVENAIDTLQLAELLSANTLKQYTLQFIKNGQLNWSKNTRLEKYSIC